MISRVCILALPALLVLGVGRGEAQITLWKLGGSGLPWAGNDSARVMIEFQNSLNAIQPIYVTSEKTVFQFLENWSPKKSPDELGFVDGERPRAWKGCCGTSSTVDNALNLIDGSGETYNPVTSNSISSEYYTIDLAVPVPVFRFTMRTPDKGFYRSDGTPLNEDAIPAFEVSIAPETNNNVLHTASPIGRVIVEERENVDPTIEAQFPRQYVRYVRYKRNNSILDEFSNQSQSHSGLARKGTVAEFEVFGEGIPKRAVYKSEIVDLGRVVNFGRLHWHITPMRIVNGAAVEAPKAKVSVQVEARTGVDSTPDVYYEYTDMGTRVPVSRDRYQNVLKDQSFAATNSDGLGNTLTVTTRPKPGLRAGIEYDQSNWTFWSFPTFSSGELLGLNRGSHLQLKVILHSERFDEFARLDSLWIEVSPILASRVLGEVARLDDPRPPRGVAAVNMGERTDFVYHVRADFESREPGFDALRIRTGSQPDFKSLEVDGAALEPTEVQVFDEEMVIRLPRKVTSTNNASLRLIFSSEVFDFARTFEGQVFDTSSDDLPQPIEGGEVSEEISTNGLRVLAASARNPSLVQNVRLSTGVLTPNEDGVHDQLKVSYSLFGLPRDVPVELRIYTLDGRQVAAVAGISQNSGPQELRWDGRSQAGKALPPGLYLLSIVVQAESENEKQLRPIGIAY